MTVTNQIRSINEEIPKDFYFEVGEGNIAAISYVHKFGRNTDIDTGGFEAIWNGGADYTGFNCTEAETIETFSGDAADAGTLLSSGTATSSSKITLVDSGATFVSDGVAIGDIVLNDTNLSHGIVKEVTSETSLTVFRFDVGETVGATTEVGNAYRVATPASTGAAVVELKHLLDGDLLNETSEFIILNGTTAVDTVGTYMRHSRASVLKAGSGDANAGELTSRQKTTTANVTMVMPLGYNSTMICAYTTPADKDGHLNAWAVSLAGKTAATCNVRLVMRHRGEVFAVKEEFSISGGASSFVERIYKVPKNDIPPGTDIMITSDTDTNNTGVSGSFDLMLSTHDE